MTWQALCKSPEVMDTSNRSRPPLILVIHDDPHWSDRVHAMLLEEGYRVIWARDALEALTLLEVLQPELMILEMVLPVMDGLGFLSHRAQEKKSSQSRFSPGPRVLAVSRLPSVLHQALDLGADAVVQRPCHSEAFLSAVSSLVHCPQENSARVSPQLEAPLVGLPRVQDERALAPKNSEPLGELMSTVGEQLIRLRRMLAVDLATVSTLSSDGLRLELVIGEGPQSGVLPGVLLSEWSSPDLMVLESSERFVVQDLCAHPLFRGGVWCTEHRLRSYLGSTLFNAQGRVAGVLSVHTQRVGFFDHGDLRTLELFATRVSQLIWGENSQVAFENSLRAMGNKTEVA
ncbi:MAG: hypothetical protein RJB38_2471 [Pseudomonadota bacterium]